MNDTVGIDRLRELLLAALAEADRQNQTLVGCLLAEALDALGKSLTL